MQSIDMANRKKPGRALTMEELMSNKQYFKADIAGYMSTEEEFRIFSINYNIRLKMSLIRNEIKNKRIVE